MEFRGPRGWPRRLCPQGGLSAGIAAFCTAAALTAPRGDIIPAAHAGLTEVRTLASGKAEGTARQLAEQVPRDVDASPLPDVRGDYISLDWTGQWRRSGSGGPFVYADATNGAQEPPADCSKQSIIHYAERAPAAFDKTAKGLLYGVRTHTSATRVDDMPGYNSCALVVHAILKRAGCQWARYTASAKKIYDLAYRAGWRPAETQSGGCLVAWNARWPGPRPRIGRGKHATGDKKGGVLFRHVGVTTGAWFSVDNSSYFSEPSVFVMTRPIRYEPPMFLCPPEDAEPAQQDG